MNIERKCAYCGKTYYITEHRLKEIRENGHESNFCSKLCLFEARKKFEMRKCLNCGAEFYPADNENRFCSTHCAHTYNRKKYTSIPADYFERLLKKYRKHITKWCFRWGYLSSPEELKEYGLYGIWLKFTRDYSNGEFDPIQNKDSGLENFKVHVGLKLGLKYFFNEVFRHNKVSEELSPDLEYMQPENNYLREKIDELLSKANDKAAGYRYLLKMKMEGATIDDICEQEKLPYDIVYNRIYRLKRCLNG